MPTAGLDMFLGYVQKIGIFRHILTMCSLREHMPYRAVDQKASESCSKAYAPEQAAPSRPLRSRIVGAGNGAVRSAPARGTVTKRALSRTRVNSSALRVHALPLALITLVDVLEDRRALRLEKFLRISPRQAVVQSVFDGQAR